jgi:hypothetical protein
MELLYDDLFAFVAKPDDPVSFCHLKVVKSTDEALILVTQRVDLDGQVAMGYSTAYAAEYLATTVVNRFVLDPATTVYLQHYERTDGSQSTYSLVEFGWTSEGPAGAGATHYTASNPRWTQIAAEDLGTLFKHGDLTRA